MITETSVIRMFLNCHDLNGIVAGFFYSRQDVILELDICTDLFGILRHTDMAFIDEQRACIDFEPVIIPDVGIFGSPDLRGENLCFVILNDALTPSGDAFTLAVIPAHIHFVQVAVFEFISGEFEFPVTVFEAFTAIRLVFLPAVEVADQINICGVRSPFAEDPAVLCTVQPEVEVSVGEIGEGTFSILRQLGDFPERVVMSSANCVLVRFEPRILFDQPDVFLTHTVIACLSKHSRILYLLVAIVTKELRSIKAVRS